MVVEECNFSFCFFIFPVSTDVRNELFTLLCVLVHTCTHKAQGRAILKITSLPVYSLGCQGDKDGFFYLVLGGMRFKLLNSEYLQLI